MAMALTGISNVLPVDTNKAISASWGTYGGQNAMAIGGTARLRGNLFLNGGGAFGTSGSCKLCRWSGRLDLRLVNFVWRAGMIGFFKKNTISALYAASLSRRLLPMVAIVVSVQTAVAQSPAPQRPNNVEIMLVKNALTAVNHGNITGNYTVLRDLGSAGFRAKNNAAQLSAIFQDLRRRKVDLSPILVLDPQFTRAPTVEQSGQLQLVGFFATQPLQVHFSLAFQRVDGGWMIDTVSLGVVDPQPPRNTSFRTQSQMSRVVRQPKF